MMKAMIIQKDTRKMDIFNIFLHPCRDDAFKIMKLYAIFLKRAKKEGEMGYQKKIFVCWLENVIKS